MDWNYHSKVNKLREKHHIDTNYMQLLESSTLTLGEILDYFIYASKFDIFKHLFENFCNDSINPNQLLCFAISNGAYEVIEYLLLNSNIDIHYNNDLPLKKSIRQNIKIVKLLLDNGANIHFSENYFLIESAQQGFGENIKLFIQHNTDVITNYDFILHEYCCCETDVDLEIVQMLVDAGANIHLLRGELLITAIENRNFMLIQFLISKGIDVNCQNGKPLRKSMKKSYGEITKLLIDSGADLGLLKTNMKMINAEREKIVDLLLEKGFSVKEILSLMLKH